MKYIIFTLTFLFSISGNAQGLEDEIAFLYTKATYLMETDRMEDAVKELNKIIRKDASFRDALLLRAEAKFALGAYVGVKKDLSQYIENSGINARVARLYGLTDYQGGNKKAALNSLTFALESIKDDKRMYETRGDILEQEGKLLQACADYKKAARLNSSKGKKKSRKLCGAYDDSDQEDHHKGDHDSERIDEQKDKVIRKKKMPTDVVLVPIDSDEIPKVDDIDDSAEIDNGEINEIEIDEDLSLIIKEGGLGSRGIIKQPNILIISEQSGEVSIDICVSKGGRVTSATFDNINSTIKKQSLVSLAIRKSKDFWFSSDSRNERCGKIVFQIKGSK